MSDKKYILTDETCFNFGRQLYRIQAVRDFNFIHEGDLGGWIEREQNLSHEGLCWVDNDAMVFEDARVMGDAYVSNKAIVRDNAIVKDDVAILAPAIISDHAVLAGDSIIRSPCRIRGGAILSERMTINEFVRFSHTPVFYTTIGPIGSRNDIMTVYLSNDSVIYVETGCFVGNDTQFARAVAKTHFFYNPSIYREYMTALKTAKIYLKRQAKTER